MGSTPDTLILRQLAHFCEGCQCYLSIQRVASSKSSGAMASGASPAVSLRMHYITVAGIWMHAARAHDRRTLLANAGMSVPPDLSKVT